MQTTKANGHAGPETPAPVTPAASTPADPFGPLRDVVRKMVARSYAEGFRRATEHLARTVGLLEGESRTKVLAELVLLEEELHKAEEAAK